ncbi:MAG TPA: hypothetical protein VF223_19130 [Trebonia sp.]
MKKPAKPSRPKKKTPVAKHPVHAPHVRAHQHQHQGQQHHKGAGPKHPGHAKAPRPRKTKAQHHKKRGLAVTDGVACCAAEALAASLRLAGRTVSDEDVLELHWRTASGPEGRASILATLKAASWHGLAGVRPSYRPWDEKRDSVSGHLIIGVQLPGGPHTLTVDPSGQVWSWGELHDLAGLGAGPVEEAWAVTWQ